MKQRLSWFLPDVGFVLFSLWNESTQKLRFIVSSKAQQKVRLELDHQERNGHKAVRKINEATHCNTSLHQSVTAVIEGKRPWRGVKRH